MRQKALEELLTFNKSRNIWPRGWGNRTCIMGVINITPDSFSDGGMFLDPQKALNQAITLVKHGADVIDIGAQSTRPGAIEVGSEEELKRLIPVLLAIREYLPHIIISIDTFLSDVAEESLNAGADWINDISGGRHDQNIHNIIVNYRCPYVITHSRGNSQTMNSLSSYGNVVKEVYLELKEITKKALDSGIHKEQIIWDPGLGFAKTTEQNISIIKNLDMFASEGYPLMIGPSRKRFIGDLTNETIEKNRIWGTAAVACRCVESKINLIRVHDVEPIFKVVLMAEAMWN